MINKVLNTDYVDTAGINEFEEIREKLRNLMKYLPNSSIRYDTNFTDEVLSTDGMSLNLKMMISRITRRRQSIISGSIRIILQLQN